MSEPNTSSREVVVQAQGVGKTVHLGTESLSILEGVDISFNARSSASIVGPSGSGKTTLLGILAGLDQASRGSAQLFGTDLGDLDEDGRAELRRGRVGFVFQSFHLLPNLTAEENVALALEVSPRASSIQTRARDALQAVGLDQRAKHLPSQLSGGEQQRVALARAMVIQPEVLFADEPTGNLDHATREHVSDLLFELCSNQGTALLLVTHDAELARRCDTMHRIEAGRLV